MKVYLYEEIEPDHSIVPLNAYARSCSYAGLVIDVLFSFGVYGRSLLCLCPLLLLSLCFSSHRAARVAPATSSKNYADSLCAQGRSRSQKDEASVQRTHHVAKPDVMIAMLKRAYFVDAAALIKICFDADERETKPRKRPSATGAQTRVSASGYRTKIVESVSAVTRTLSAYYTLRRTFYFNAEGNGALCTSARRERIWNGQWQAPHREEKSCLTSATVVNAADRIRKSRAQYGRIYCLIIPRDISADV